MHSRWDSKSTIFWQQQINTALDPIIARHNYYVLAKTNMLKSVSDYFFITANQDKFAELEKFLAGDGEIKPVNMTLLATPIDDLVQFTEAINNSGLGLVLNVDFFEFNYKEGMRPETIEFMNKLGLALGACRACVGLEQIYRILLADPHIQTYEYEQYPKQVKELAQHYNLGPNPGDDYAVYLKAYYQHAVTIQKNLKEQRAQVNVWKEQFADLIQKTVVVVCDALQGTVTKLIAGTTAFQDKTWLGDGWNRLVVKLIGEFAARYYHYAYWISGALSFNLDYPALLGRELATFSLTMQDKMAHLKLTFLDEAEIELEDLIRTIQNEAAIRSIPLVEERQTFYRDGSMSLLFTPDASLSGEASTSYQNYSGFP